ncbi:MAG: TolC family protein [Rhodothermaceae bacterium]|nr:TolC family protein [Rhodothermaceae bacterium]
MKHRFKYKPTTGLLATGLICLLFIGGCSMTPRLQEPDTVSELPDTYGAGTQDTTYSPITWWSEFNDPVLSGLVDSALTRNLDLKSAMARVSEIQNQYRIARSPLFPAVQATADGNRQNIPSNTGAFSSIGGDDEGGGGAPAGGFQLPDRFETVTYSASLGLSYELDFWGKNRNAAQAALREFKATRADYQTTLLGIISETIATYFEITDLEQQLVHSTEIVDLLNDRVELTEDRYQRGLITSFELYTIRQSYETEQASLPLLESSLNEAKGRLAILLGYYPGAIHTILSQDQLAEIQLSPIPVGLPSSLLQERPDIYAAEQRLQAALHRIGSAKAAQFPSISLTGSGGTQSADLANLLDIGTQGFSNLAGSIVQPLFQGGRLKADVQVAWAQYEQVKAAYEKTVLTAFKEVNAALVGIEKETVRFRFLEEATRNAESSSQTQEDRFERGVGDYLAYIDARINELRTKNALETAKRSLVNARLTLHRSLGGGWVDYEL